MDFQTQTIAMKTMFITPDLARLILSHASANRPITENHVTKLARDMVNGFWEQTGEPIKFNEHGKLIDGQHRLHAVVKSGVTIEFVVITGLSVNSQDTMDSGKRRSLGDQLSMRGYKSTNQLAAAIVLSGAWEKTGRPVRQGFRATNSESLRWFEKNPELEKGINATFLARRKIRYPGGLAAAVYYRMSQISPPNADFFWTVLGNGNSPTGANMIVTLRERMIRAAIKREGNSQRMSDLYRAALTVKTWNAWIEGRELSKLSWRPELGENFPTLAYPDEAISAEDLM